MQNTGNQRLTVKKIEWDRGALLSMYLAPPTEEITIDEFEEFALDRLKVLKTIEWHRNRNSSAADLVAATTKSLRENVPLTDTPDQEEPSVVSHQRRKDLISHFILRLSYCHSEELRRWFLAQETALFKLRLERLTDAEKQNFMRINNLHYEEFRETDRVKQKLKDASGQFGTNMATVTSYYKIPFIDALELVAHRRVYVEQGFAIVPVSHLVSIIVARFRMNLSRALATAYKSFGMIKRDERLAPTLMNLSKQYIGRDYGNVTNTARLTPDQLDMAADTWMPLCMRTLHHTLRKQHKLKHQGRLQYGLFLKGAGLSLEDAILFWQSEFTKVMTLEEFNKQYLYNIRFNYGKEGKRVDYTPFSCQKIIMGPVPTKESVHGCPFRHFGRDQLASHLQKLRLTAGQVDNIMASVDRKDYQLACVQHFEASHPGADLENVGNHPNSWFHASREYHRAKAQPEVADSQEDSMVVEDSHPEPVAVNEKA